MQIERRRGKSGKCHKVRACGTVTPWESVLVMILLTLQYATYYTCNLYLITFFMFAKSQLSSKRPPVFYLMMDLVQAAIPFPPGTAWKTVQVALRPSPSQKLAITFIHTQRVLASYRRLAHHSLKMLMASCAALIKATLKSEMLMQGFTEQK